MFQLDRSRSAEDIDHHRDTTMRFVNGVDFTFEVFEMAILDTHPIALLELDRCLDFLTIDRDKL